MKLRTDSCYVKHSERRICQGDLFRDVRHFLWIDIKEKEIEGDELIVPYLVILTQECDLEQDFKYHNEEQDDEDKYLQSILVSPAYLSEQLKEGIHLKELGLTMQEINSKNWSNIKTNQNSRYHYLCEDKKYKLPELVIDFKHYYTIPRDYFYQYFQEHYICTIDQLFRESLSQRFSYYLSRIGLPALKKE